MANSVLYLLKPRRKNGSNAELAMKVFDLVEKIRLVTDLTNRTCGPSWSYQTRYGWKATIMGFMAANGRR